jgi:hypothetical protein
MLAGGGVDKGTKEGGMNWPEACVLIVFIIGTLAVIWKGMDL